MAKDIPITTSSCTPEASSNTTIMRGISDLKDITPAASEEYKPLPEVASVISDLKLLLHSLAGTPQWESINSLSKAIEILEKGEPFHPEPHPKSAQGAWKETARHYASGQEFYQNIVTKVGEIIGEEAYTADDGTVGDSVLALKVPEIIQRVKDTGSWTREYPDPAID